MVITYENFFFFFKSKKLFFFNIKNHFHFESLLIPRPQSDSNPTLILRLPSTVQIWISDSNAIPTPRYRYSHIIKRLNGFAMAKLENIFLPSAISCFNDHSPSNPPLSPLLHSSCWPPGTYFQDYFQWKPPRFLFL